MIRLYTPADLEPVISLFRQTVRIVCNGYYSPEELEAWACSLPDAVSWERFLEERYTLVMDSGDEITGFGCLSADGSTVDMLYTHHAHQSEGIGSALLEALEKQALHCGNKEVKLTTSVMARPFYRKRGYRYHHSEKKTYGTVIFDCQVLSKYFTAKTRNPQKHPTPAVRRLF